MLLQEPSKAAIVKAYPISSRQVLAMTESSIQLYDIRKPAIIVSQTCFEHTPSAENPDNELNDIDVRFVDESTLQLAYCFDSGETTISNLNVDSFALEEKT